MPLSYNVVYEYTTKAGGYAGVRTITSYRDKADFEKFYAKHDPEWEKIVAQGVSDEEAQDLTALTPEICRLTAAIHEACNNDGQGKLPSSPKMLQYRLELSAFGIEHDRQHRHERGLAPLTSFPFVEIKSQDTPRDMLYQFIKDHFSNPTGEIGDISFALIEIYREVVSILKKKFMSAMSEL